jgi:hypothetical protein
MASFAQLNEDNHVINVVKIANDNDILDSDGNESEALGIAKCKSLFGLNTKWKQTWFSENPRRFRTAIVDGEYIPEHNVFTKRKPYASWTLNTTTYEWEPPTPQPATITATPEQWIWQESSTSWVKESIPEPEAIEGGTYSWNTTDSFWEWTETPVEESSPE